MFDDDFTGNPFEARLEKIEAERNERQRKAAGQRTNDLAFTLKYWGIFCLLALPFLIGIGSAILK